MTACSNAVQRFGPGWADPYRTLHSCCRPCGPTRRRSGTRRRRPTTASKGTLPGPCRCSSDTSGMGRPWAFGPSPISPAPLRPTRSAQSPPESTRSAPFSDDEIIRGRFGGGEQKQITNSQKWRERGEMEREREIFSYFLFLFILGGKFISNI